ncbi:MAG: hypothetical protein KC425_19475 [Anaerolineales bacterium]|nr:hypothetical protein [Anaerolineales bacterium]
MDIKKALDDLLQTHHDRLSLMALQGYFGNGRGAIPLQITLIPFHDSDRQLVRISVREYCVPAVDDPDLARQVQTYNPSDTGVLLFRVQPGDWSGCLTFALAHRARGQYPA